MTEFEWDPAKAASNLAKHGVSFEEASTSFDDPSGGILDDPRHSGSDPAISSWPLPTAVGSWLPCIQNAATSSASLAPVAPPALSAEPMKNVRGKRAPKKSRPTSVPDDEILPEYDFSNARPNKYARRLSGGRNIVVLEPDVARRFPSSDAVNEALRALLEIADKARAPSARRRRTA